MSFRQRASELSRPVERLHRGPASGSWLHSLADAYGAESANRVSRGAFEGSAISIEEWSSFLAGLSERMKANWHARYKPLSVAKEHVYVYLSVAGGFVKKRYSMAHA
jgi:hypothetical protein